MSTSRRGLASAVVLSFAVCAAMGCRHAPAPCAAGDPTTISVGSAPAVCGKPANDPNVYTYQGIPFAAPPVDELRWQPPQSIPWPPAKAVQRIAFGHKCTQQALTLTGYAGNEDCLYLNVWTPRGAINGAKKLPVMVFIHGGAFELGSGASPIFEGSNYADSGVVLVTLNYRLGAFGFLVASGYPITGNQGLLDQQMAMSWVRANIDRFGGDRAKITLFGESAGAESVGLHYFSMPSSQALFDAALMESNPLGVVYASTNEALRQGKSFLNDLCTVYTHYNRWHFWVGCDREGWLRHVTTHDIIRAQAMADKASSGFKPSLPWAPYVDGTLVTGEPYRGFAPNIRGGKPLGFGVNRDEGVLFAALDYRGGKKAFTTEAYDRDLASFGPAIKQDILAQPRYDPAQVPSPGYYNNVAAAFANVVTDYVFNCGNLLAANKAATAAPPSPVFGYRFTQPPFFDLYDLGLFPADGGACALTTGNVCHGNELPYVFGNLAAVEGPHHKRYTPGAGDLTLASAMTSAWVGFAKDPGHPGGGWLPYTPPAGPTALQQWNSSHMGPVDLYGPANCSIWLRARPYVP